MTDSEPRKLSNLRVIDLRLELEKRNIDKNGVKAILLERLEKALKEEGHDPETYVFDDPAGKQIPKRSRRSEGDDSESVDVSEDDKDEGVSEEINASQEQERKVVEENSNQETEDSSTTDVKGKDPESAKPVKESLSKESGVEKVTEDSPSKTTSSDTTADNQKAKPSPRKSTRKSVAEENQKSSDEKETAPEVIEKSTEEKKTPSKTKADNDDGKATPEANGIDNEDSINLTIEDDEKLLADEEDVSQEKDNKDESLSGAGLHKQTSGEKNQDKVNSEDKEEKSGSAEEAAKDDKSKKPAVASANTSRNLWVSSLSSATRATDLKQVFSKFGKVVGAKVVTNARTPGARCYGYVTMASSDDATKAIESLHLTELHGRMISVEKAKGDSSGPPKRSADSSKTDQPVPKKMEDRKRERDRVSSRNRPEAKSEEIVPPGTEGDLKTEPAAPGTEGEVSAETEDKDKETTHRSRDASKTDHRADKRPRSATSSHKSRDRSKHRKSSPNVLTFSKIKEERDKQLMREKERMLREEQRRRDSERQRQREIERRQKEEYMKLERERHKLKLERERVERERTELLKLKRERQRLERERHRIEREKLEREKEELERLKRQTLNRLEEERRKRSLSSSRDREYEGNRKRQATDVRYDTSHGRFQDNRADFKKESSHKTSEVSNSRHYVADSWKEQTGAVMEDWSKDRFSSRYVERTGGSFRNQDESVSARAKSDRHPRDRYQDTNKGERYTERQVDTWHSGNVGMKSFGSGGNGRDTWVSGASERKVDSSQSWPRPPANANRWSGGGGPLNMNNRGPQVGPGSIFPPNLESGLPGLGILGMGPFSGNGGNRFESYKLPY